METGGLRKIIHVDMDAFYASVEVRDNPALKGQPVIVGGSPRSRGVVAAASYEARRYGIHSAMPCARAYRLCPQAVFLAPDFDKYRAVSRQIREIFYRYTDQVEPLSLDEAYLDVTVNRVGEPSATRIAQAIRQAIREETGLTASAGVAPNKFLAKIASDENKPDGLLVIRPRDVPHFVKDLPLRKVPGVGRSTQEAFERLGLYTCGQVQALSLADLEHHFGKRGSWFHRIARGIDDRPVESARERKSVSVEDTFAEDHDDPAWLQDRLAELCTRLGARARAARVKGRTITLKLRLSDFRTFTRSLSVAQPTNDPGEIVAHARTLMQRSGFVGERLRLLGIGLSQLDTAQAGSRPASQMVFPWAGGE